MRTSPARSSARSRRSLRTSARERSPTTRARTRSPTKSSPHSSSQLPLPAREGDDEREGQREEGEGGEGERTERPDNAPPLDDADPVEEQRCRPGGEEARDGVEHGDPDTSVRATRTERVAPVDSEPHGPDEQQPDDQRSARVR